MNDVLSSVNGDVLAGGKVYKKILSEAGEVRE